MTKKVINRLYLTRLQVEYIQSEGLYNRLFKSKKNVDRYIGDNGAVLRNIYRKAGRPLYSELYAEDIEGKRTLVGNFMFSYADFTECYFTFDKCILREGVVKTKNGTCSVYDFVQDFTRELGLNFRRVNIVNVAVDTNVNILKKLDELMRDRNEEYEMFYRGKTIGKSERLRGYFEERTFSRSGRGQTKRIFMSDGDEGEYEFLNAYDTVFRSKVSVTDPIELKDMRWLDLERIADGEPTVYVTAYNRTFVTDTVEENTALRKEFHSKYVYTLEVCLNNKGFEGVVSDFFNDEFGVTFRRFAESKFVGLLLGASNARVCYFRTGQGSNINLYDIAHGNY